MLFNTPQCPEWPHPGNNPAPNVVSCRGEKVITLIVIVMFIKYYLHAADEETDVQKAFIWTSGSPRYPLSLAAFFSFAVRGTEAQSEAVNEGSNLQHQHTLLCSRGVEVPFHTSSLQWLRWLGHSRVPIPARN